MFDFRIHWLDDWSSKSFILLPNYISPGTQRELASESFYRLHSTLPDATVSQYKNLVLTYLEVHSRESSKISDRQAKLTKGVSKLTEAKEVVKRLKSEAAEQEKQLAEKQSEANDALQMITDTMKNANQQKVKAKLFANSFQSLPCFRIGFN